ncbi:hypothetical protein [Bacillus cereus]|uniref:hypothetical protein n=1 Tax=Bacillus cereus TaxID=1396 RepID=UPI001C3F34E1|nr:hypothetical protein [Bacillus cereus]
MGTVAKIFYMFATVYFLCAQNNDLCVLDFVEGKIARAIKSVLPLGALLVLL